jgi:glycogen debranching enzyme
MVLAVLLLAGCGPGAPPDPPRAPLRLDELEIRVAEGRRSFFLSDRRGGFLMGSLSPGRPWEECSWSVNGQTLITRLRITRQDRGEGDDAVDSALIRPDRVAALLHGGRSVSVEPVEGGIAPLHAILIRVGGAGPGPAGLVLTPGVGFKGEEKGTDAISRWRGDSPRSELTLLKPGPDTWLLVFSTGPLEEATQRDLQSRALGFSAARSGRMDRLLERAHLRFSDPDLTRAIAWMRLAVDALVCSRAETLAVSGLPWDGTFSGRENARALSIMGLATGEYATARGVARALAARQDTIAESASYGRIPELISEKGLRYGGADVSPWFVREVYEYIARSNDVPLAARLYPVVKRSIAGAARANINGQNLFVHAPSEVGMGGGRFAAAGAGKVAAVEMQLLWFFQQLIGSFLADHVGDRPSAVAWQRGAKTTERSFDRAFVDSAHSLLYDHLDRGGRGVAVLRPNGLFALEILGSERVQQAMLRTVTGSLLYPHGLGTLGSSEQGFNPLAPSGPRGPGSPPVDGPVLTSLLSQATYALTRYDRQDLSARVLRTLARRALSDGMAGTLPEMMDVVPPDGEAAPREGGALASLTGMTEFLRAVYSDHLGIHLDAPSGMIRTEPKLPADLSRVEFTVPLGEHLVSGSYHRTEEGGRMTLHAPSLTTPMRWGFTWMQENGDAWRGSVVVPPGSEITLVFGREEMMAFDGTGEIPCEGCYHIRGFSRRDDIGGLRLADPSR